MRCDVAHIVLDRRDPVKPCGGIAMTLLAPPSPGQEIVPSMVAWPRYEYADADAAGRRAIVCGTCGRYAGQSLILDAMETHICYPVQRPDGGWICRAGCEVDNVFAQSTRMFTPNVIVL